MAKAPRMHYKPWTSTEIKSLRKLANQRLGLDKIAKELKRTTWAVRNRASSEGISLRTER
ncbi:MAG: hypothetical protein GC206_06880 [Alphaproteobacteria bacterium]|nr:hypothetical protein [Alphaproteobacteria bacterium]